MLKYQLFTIYVFLHTLLCGCSQPNQAGFDIREDAFEVEQVARLPKEVSESSGLARASDGNLWTHNDAGNQSYLYKVDVQGELLEYVQVEGIKNKDWEALASDGKGNVYIGDFGNNNNKRRDLRILKVKEPGLELLEEIKFSYPDQTEFPPPKKERSFDCEGFFWHNGYCYLFSKNRGGNDWVKMYRVPDSGGPHVAELVDSVKINTMITGADMSPDGKIAALVGYGYIFVFESDDPEKMFKNKKYCIPVGKSGQAEAILFLNEEELLFSNEGGKLFKVFPKK